MIRILRARLTITAILGACLALPALAACGRGQIEPASAADAREFVHLSAKEREHLRLGMRQYLESTQGIMDAMTERKMSAVAEHARKAGMSAVTDMPLGVAAKLPPGFVLLSLDTHQRFDALSQYADDRKGSRMEVMQHLRDILANCTACHATYRVGSE